MFTPLRMLGAALVLGGACAAASPQREPGARMLTVAASRAQGEELRVHPRAAVRVTVSPRDTAVYVGDRYALRVSVESPTGVALPAEIEAVVSDDPAVAAAGASVRGVAVGRTRILVTAGDRQVPVYVSVVPRGTLAAAGPDGIYTFGLDGSGYGRVATAQGARSPRWLPGGERFVFTQGTFGTARVSDLQDQTRPLVRGGGPPPAQLWVHPSRDGQWMYFGGYGGRGMRGDPYRVRADGTAVQVVPGIVPGERNQSHPSPSPRGDRVAYFREDHHSRDVTLRILHVPSGRLLLRDVPGHSPEWSHGDSIAYIDVRGRDRGPIRLMSSTGEGHRQVGTGTGYAFGMDWSPDDRWIVALNADSRYLEAIRVADGTRVPLPYSEGLFDPAWKP